MRRRFLGEIACGPLSLISALESLGIPLSRSDAMTIIAAAGNRGTDMLTLAQLAETFGVHTKGVEISINELLRSGLPAVVHVNGIGFAAVTEYGIGDLTIKMPLEAPQRITGRQFARMFGQRGRALLIGTRPIEVNDHANGLTSTAASHTPLRLSSKVLSVGRIHDRAWMSSITLHNDGDHPITITNVERSNEGFKAIVEPRTIQAGESATLKASGVQVAPGPFTYQVLVVPDDNELKPITVPIRGYVVPAFFSDVPVVHLGRAIVGGRAQSSIRIELVPGVSFEDIAVRVPSDVPLSATLESGVASHAVLTVAVRGEERVGKHHYRIEAGTRSDTGVFVPIDVHVDIVPPLEVFPPTLWISTDEAARGWMRTIRVRHNRSSLSLNGEADEHLPQLVCGWSDPQFNALVKTEQKPTDDPVETLLIMRGSGGDKLLPDVSQVDFQIKRLNDAAAVRLNVDIRPDTLSVGAESQ